MLAELSFSGLFVSTDVSAVVPLFKLSLLSPFSDDATREVARVS